MLDLDRAALQADYDKLCLRGFPGIDVEELTFSLMHGNGNVILVVDETLSRLTAGTGPVFGACLEIGAPIGGTLPNR